MTFVMHNVMTIVVGRLFLWTLAFELTTVSWAASALTLTTNWHADRRHIVAIMRNQRVTWDCRSHVGEHRTLLTITQHSRQTVC